MSAPRAARPGLRLALGLLAVGALGLLWVFAVEPYWIETTHHTVPAAVTASLRIAHLSDLHTEGVGRLERALLRRLEAEKPDLIVVTGDTVTTGGTAAGYRAVWQALVGLDAPLGVVAVRGNWEYWAAPMGSESAADEAGVTTLVNESLQVREDAWVLGLDDPLAGEEDAAATSVGVPAGSFKLGLMHSLDEAPAFASRVELMLGGHTHGGQIVIPLWGPPWLPPGSGDYVGGWYDESGTPLYVSRGIGTSVLPIRFNCRPELAIIDVVPAG